MFSSEPMSGQSTVSAKQVAASAWILRPRGDSNRETASDLRSAFDGAVRRGAHDVVVVLGAASSVDADLVDVVRAMAETMLARDSLLWLAAPWPDGCGHTLRPVRELGLDALRGVSEELDLALADYEEVRPRRLGTR